MDIEKSCRNCKECILENQFTYNIEADVYNIGESGFIEEIAKDYLNITETLEHMQEQGIIKKNINIKELAQDDYINTLLVEQIGNAVFSFLIKQIKGIRVNLKPTSTDFYCKYWR
jgi:hypothetical protein